MAVRLLAAAAALVVLAAGCGGDGPSRRDVVVQYLNDVNTIQISLAKPARAISTASVQLSRKNANHAAAEAKLLRAAQTIERLRGRLARLKAPVEARRLRALLLEVSDREAALVREVAALSAFLPKFVAVLTPLGPAGSELQAALSAKGPVDAKAAALETYSAKVGAVSRRLRLLKAPPVSAPGLATQLTTLTRVRASTSALAKALRDQRAEAIPILKHRFDLAAVSNQSLAAQHVRIQAVVDYNARVRKLSGLEARINRERLRLQKALD